MNTYIVYDPVTTLVTGITYSTVQPAVSILGTATEITNLQLGEGVLGWTVQNGVLTAPTPASLLLAAQMQQVALIRVQCTQAIFAGFPIVEKGQTYTVTLREDILNHDQTNILGVLVSANSVIMSAMTWKANMVVDNNAYCTDGAGNYYIAFEGGTTGSTIPTWPTSFQVPVMDNNVVWFLMGFRISTVQGRVFIDPVTMISVGAKMLAFKNAMQAKYDSLKAQIMAATDIPTVQSYVWS